jgi:hypothetical protein
MENNTFTVDERAVVFERYDDEVIAINLNTGMYYLNYAPRGNTTFDAVRLIGFRAVLST